MRPLWIAFLVPLTLGGVVGCMQRPPQPARSQLAVREFQTQTFRAKNSDEVLKAIIDALQDDGYLIRNTDRALGFISAVKQVDSDTPLISRILIGSDGRYPVNSEIETSIHVTGRGEETRVRAVFVTKSIDNFGAPLGVANIDEVRFYREFFSKVEKSLYYLRQHL